MPSTDERQAENPLPGLAAQDYCGGLVTPMVAHPRISKSIAAGVRGPLTRIIGPPDAGKIMAIAVRAAGCDHPCTLACFSRDDYSPPAVLCSYVAAGFRRAGGAVPQVLSVPRHPERPRRSRRRAGAAAWPGTSSRTPTPRSPPAPGHDDRPCSSLT
jgi:hypothetical protein